MRSRTELASSTIERQQFATIRRMALVLIVLLTAGSAACKKAAPPVDVTPPAVAKMACENPAHDFGDVLQGERLIHVFRLKNAGSAPLFVERVEKAYSCAATLFAPMSLAEGANLDLEVACDTREREGRVHDVLVVRSNDAVARELELTIEAQVEPLLAFMPKLVDLRTAFGVRASSDVLLTGRLAREAKLRVERTEGSGVDARWVAGDGGGPGLVRLTLGGHQVGSGAGRVFVSTGLAQPAELIFSYSWQVSGNLEVSPETPYINLREPGPKEVVLKLRSGRADFRLDAVQVIEGPFEARFDRNAASSGYSVEVRAVESRIPPGERGVLGRVVLVSNDPAEPRKEVAVFALGVVNRGARAPDDSH